MNNKKGLSLVEVVVSAGAFVVFAMLIQSILLLAHSFQVESKKFIRHISSQSDDQTKGLYS